MLIYNNDASGLVIVDTKIFINSVNDLSERRMATVKNDIQKLIITNY